MTQIRISTYGMVNAKKAEQFSIGETVLWNFGEKSVVKEITHCGKKSLKISFLSTKGIPHERTVPKSYLMAIA